MLSEQVRIADPCHADWDAMRGDERARFCGACTRHVHDLSAMTDREARALLASTPNVCVRYAVDADGRIRHVSRRVPRLVAFGVALLGAAPAFASGALATPPEPSEPGLMERVVRRVQEAVGYGPTGVVSEGEVELRMGDIAPPPPRMLMGAPVPQPPTIEVPVPPATTVQRPRVPASARIPEPPAGASVIPEVAQALEAQRRD
jgi:hypothetical protein